MSVPRGHTEPGPPKPKALAFYLPQYHPIPENDRWWGKGFTEWTNVTRAKPLFPGHYQPHVPGELGYYDLRVPEVREAQAELARSHGISGFVYYHYWFQGKRLLHRPFDEVLASGTPDFPFALCWANEEWTRHWDGKSGTVLMPQEHSDEDDLAHIRWLCEAFEDPRYIRINGRPLMLIYRPGLLADPERTARRWRTEAQRLGISDLYLCWVDGWGRPEGGPQRFGFDATVGFMPLNGEQLFTPIESMRPHRILDYVSAYEERLAEPAPDWKHFPSVMVGWDNTARHPSHATIFDGASPAAYRAWLERTVASTAGVPDEENYLFVLAWNEWAEGNHLEPDQRYGRSFLEATRSVLIGGPSDVSEDLVAHSSDGPQTLDGDVASNLSDLIDRFGADADGPTVALVPKEARERPDGGYRVHIPGGRDVATYFYDNDDLIAWGKTLDQLDSVGGFLLIDVIEKLASPQPLLESLSAWSLSHGSPLLYVVVPNISHFDNGMRLLAGHWGDAPSAGGGDLHYFTSHALEQLLRHSGWNIVARGDVCAIESGRHDSRLSDELPEELIGALRVVSENFNPQWATETFVWALVPGPPGEDSDGFGDEAGRRIEEPSPSANDRRRAVERYLSSVGLVASETNRRAANHRRIPRPGWQRAMLRLIRATPWSSSTYQRIREKLG